MGMMIDEIIAKEQEISQTFQKIVDTQMVSEDLSLDEMYCGDTEIIEEELQRNQELADYHNQIVNTMCKYQKIKQIIRNYDVAWEFPLLVTHRMKDTIDKIRDVIGDENDK